MIAAPFRDAIHPKIGALRAAAGAIVLCSGMSGALAQGNLPPGIAVPALGAPAPDPTQVLLFDGIELIEKGRSRHFIQLDRFPFHWADETLRIAVGYQEQWTPGDYYALLPSGYDQEPNRAIAFIATEKIRFDKAFDPGADAAFRSVNREGVCETYVYHVNGRLKTRRSWTRGGAGWTREYDADGKLVRETHEGGAQTRPSGASNPPNG